MQYVLPALLILAITIIAFAVYSIVQNTPRRRHIRARSRNRQSDQRKFTRNEKKQLDQAEQFILQGKIAAASRVYEQLQLYREAIQTLEDHNMIHEAAKILMRLQRHNRAGVIYARHGMWEYAAQAFKLAQMPLEVAKCAREAGNLDMAGEYFVKANRHQDAAECYRKKGDLAKAARLFYNAGELRISMELYSEVIGSVDNGKDVLDLDRSEVEDIISFLEEGNFHPTLFQVAIKYNRHIGVILGLTKFENIDHIIAAMQASPPDFEPKLLADIDYRDPFVNMIANAFHACDRHKHAGIIYENLEQFDNAGKEFELAKEFVRAIYCYERSGNHQKASELKSHRNNNHTLTSIQDETPSGFSLSDVKDTEHFEKHETTPLKTPISVSHSFQENSEEATAIVSTQALTASTPPLPVESQSVESQSSNAAPQALNSMPMQPQPMTAPGPAMEMNQLKINLGEKPKENSFSNTDAESTAILDSSAFHPQTNDTKEDYDATAIENIGHRETSSDSNAHFSVYCQASFVDELTERQIKNIWTTGDTKTYTADQVVLDFQETPEGLYIILEGEVDCYRTSNGQEIKLDKMGLSQSFGELWLLADHPTEVKFVANCPTALRIIPRTEFTDLLDNDGTLARKVYKRFTMRLLKSLVTPRNNSEKKQAS